jgi:hypothetical protein
VLFPTRRAFDQANVRSRTRFDVFQHRLADREVDRDIVTPQYAHQLVHVEPDIIAPDNRINFIACLAGFGENELTHRTKPDQRYSHIIVEYASFM